MLERQPERRITALEALMHDFCIVNKINCDEPKSRVSLGIPSAEEFLSHYSLEPQSNKRLKSRNLSLNSFARNDRLSFKFINEASGELNDARINKKNSGSTNDVSSKALLRPQDSFTNQLFAMLGSPEKPAQLNRLNSNLASAVKKSKFAL